MVRVQASSVELAACSVSVSMGLVELLFPLLALKVRLSIFSRILWPDRLALVGRGSWSGLKARMEMEMFTGMLCDVDEGRFFGLLAGDGECDG